MQSNQGKGTTLRIYLPRLARPSDPEVIWSSPASLCGGNETILLVEDESSVRTTIRTALSRLGYRTVEASSAVEALEVWNRHRSEIQLVLTDNQLCLHCSVQRRHCRVAKPHCISLPFRPPLYRHHFFKLFVRFSSSAGIY
jgi:hypothetical protein